MRTCATCAWCAHCPGLESCCSLAACAELERGCEAVTDPIIKRPEVAHALEEAQPESARPEEVRLGLAVERRALEERTEPRSVPWRRGGGVGESSEVVRLEAPALEERPESDGRVMVECRPKMEPRSKSPMAPRLPAIENFCSRRSMSTWEASFSSRCCPTGTATCDW